MIQHYSLSECSVSSQNNISQYSISTATVIIVCSFLDCLRYTEWSTADCLKPRLFVMTVVSIFCHSCLACFNPYKAFFSLQMDPCWPGFSYPAGGSMYTSSSSGAFRYVLLMSTWCISQSCWVLRFNLVRVEIRELRPEVIAESDEVLVHYRSRTNVWRGLSTKTLA